MCLCAGDYVDSHGEEPHDPVAAQAGTELEWHWARFFHIAKGRCFKET